MSKETARRYKRHRASQLLEEAAKLFAEGAKKMTKAARALQLVEQAEVKVQAAAEVAQHTRLKDEAQPKAPPTEVRTGLPAPVRRKLQTASKRMRALAKEVREYPITSDERALRRAGR